MITPATWLESLGVGGQLALFFKCVFMYFLVDMKPSFGAAAVKCAPVMSLMASALLRASTLPPARGRYALCIGCGLTLSALGDALLVWPAWLVPGMAAFGGAHAFYVAALGWRGRAAGAALAAYGGAALFLQCVPPPAPLRAPAALYAALLATMAWRGAARGGSAAVGAALFVLSDALLAYSLFAHPLPGGSKLVMATYYAAQMSLTYSALEPLEPLEQDSTDNQ